MDHSSMPFLNSDNMNGVIDVKGQHTATLDRVDAARIDGRARNIRYRQKQLLLIHSFLLEHESALSKAVQQDTGRNTRECQYEVSTTIELVEKHYKNLDFDGALFKEKKIAAGCDATDWREPFGTVAIVCEARNPINLAVSPLAAAIAAGNCAILVIPSNRSSATCQLLQEMISSLDNDTYALLVTNDVQAVVVPGVQCLILQSSSYPLPEIKETTVIRPSKGSSCAIVDRSTKDLKDAATRIAQAKFAYGGSSPFAPEFVLVHEVVKSEFLRELFAAISQYFPDNIPVKDQEEFARLADVQSQLTSSKTGYGRVVMSGNGSGSDSQSVAPVVIEGDRRRGTELCRLVGNTPMLPIFSTRSLDDAINYSTTLLDGSALALYLFAGGPDASYLGQFIESKSVFINEIPQSLSVGAALPQSAVQPDPILRYTTDMLSVPKLFSVAQPGKQGEFLRIKNHAPLTPPEQAPGKRIDFFMQGLRIGGSTLLLFTTATIAVSGWGAWKLFRR